MKRATPPRNRATTRLLLTSLALLAPFGWVGCNGDDGWTTESREAEAALERCLEAQMKLYHQEARAECRQAVELDPDMVMPKLLLVDRLPPEPAKALIEELRAVDLDTLNERERFLVRRAFAEPDERADLLTAYLEKHPKDPFALNIRCEMLWIAQDWDAAEPCYVQLLEADPNWVQAQNRLGYAALARGRFDEAEERFETYRYIAPDQANPHDSLGELLLLRGRYDEAATAFEKALATRADFCPSYEHLILTRLLEHREDQARQALKRMEEQEACVHGMRFAECRIGIWSPMLEGDYAGAWEAANESACAEKGEDLFLMAYEAALKGGHTEAVADLDAMFDTKRRERRLPPHALDHFDIFATYMGALRAEAAGDPARAATLYGEADAGIAYWDNAGASFFKLFIRLHQADALEAAGDADAARRVREEVRAVNPRLVADWARAT